MREGYHTCNVGYHTLVLGGLSHPNVGYYTFKERC